MKLINIILIYLMNMFSCENIYELGEIDGKYFIYIKDNYKNIASVYIRRILFLHIPILILSDAYYTYNDDEKKFIYYHEIAHYKLKHYLVYIGFSKRKRKELEYIADEYAMKKVGKETTLNALNRTRNILIELDCKLDEINERIELIELKDECICV